MEQEGDGESLRPLLLFADKGIGNSGLDPSYTPALAPVTIGTLAQGASVTKSFTTSQPGLVAIRSEWCQGSDSTSALGYSVDGVVVDAHYKSVDGAFDKDKVDYVFLPACRHARAAGVERRRRRDEHLAHERRAGRILLCCASDALLCSSRTWFDRGLGHSSGRGGLIPDPRTLGVVHSVSEFAISNKLAGR